MEASTDSEWAAGRLALGHAVIVADPCLPRCTLPKPERWRPTGRVPALTDLIEINIANLAGVPSIVYGLMALGLLVYEMRLGQSTLTGGLTLGLLILPVVIMATREALRAVPGSIREAAYALGATRWQMVKDHLLPYSAGRKLSSRMRRSASEICESPS